MAITYRTVIAQAIGHFNDVQGALAALGAKYNGKVIDAISTNATYIPTGSLSTIISEQLQLKAANNIRIEKKEGTDVSAYATASVIDASGFKLEVDSKSGTNVGIGTIANGYYPVTAIVSGTFSAETPGWFTSGSAATTSAVVVGQIAKAQFTVTGGEVKASTAGYIAQGTSVASVSAGKVDVESEASVSVTKGTGTTDESSNLFTNDTNGACYKIVFNEEVKKTVTAGYVTNTDVTVTDAPQTERYIKESSIAVESATATPNNTITPAQQATIASGFYPSARVVRVSTDATAAAANILTGKTAWVNNALVTGTMANNSGKSYTKNPEGTSTVSYSYTIPAGYHDGTSKVGGSLTLGTSTLTLEAPAFTVLNKSGTTATENVFLTSAPSSDYYKLQIKSKATTTKGYTAGSNSAVATTATEYYLPKATFKYIEDHPDMIACDTAGYISAGDIAVGSGSIDYAEITGVLNATLNSTDSNSSLFLSSKPSDASTYYTIKSAHTVTSAGFVSQNASFEDEERYIKKGVEPAAKSLGFGEKATIPAGFYPSAFEITNGIGAATIDVQDTSATVSTVTVGDKTGNTYKISGSGSVTTQSKVTTAGYISADKGTKNTGSVSITVDATIAAGSVSCEKATQVANTTAPTALKGKALTSTSTATDYVYVDITRPAVTVTEGYVDSSNNLSADSTGKVYIPAVLAPSVSTPVSGSGTIGTATTFNATTGDKSAGNKDGNIDVDGSATNTTYKDKYIVKEIGVSASGTAEAHIADDATGSNVDIYVEALYKRILGQTYTDVSVD